VNRIVEVRNGDTLGTLRGFLKVLWEHSCAEALLAPYESKDGLSIESRIITDISELSGVSPFAPLMTSNAVRLVNRFRTDHPEKRLVILLRPCELRTLLALVQRNRPADDYNQTVVIGVDCLGTLHPDEYFQAVRSRGSHPLTRAALRNAASGGLKPQQFRNACQICVSPAPIGADLIIGTLGVETDQHLLVIARDEETASRLRLELLTDAPASEYHVSHRETVAGAVADLRTAVRKGLVDQNQAGRFEDWGRLLAWFARCDLCGKCLEACPLYEGELDGFFGKAPQASQTRPPLAILAAIGRWLADCSGCGMCEQNCERNLPLSLFLAALSQGIHQEMDYRGKHALSCPYN
jgi:ferredoxin